MYSSETTKNPFSTRSLTFLSSLALSRFTCRVVPVVFFLHGPHGLLVKVPIEELVVQEHAGDIGYPGVSDPMIGVQGKALHRLYPSIQEHQGMLGQVGPGTEDSPTDPAGEKLDVLALERVVAQAKTFLNARPRDIGDVVEPEQLL